MLPFFWSAIARFEPLALGVLIEKDLDRLVPTD